MITMFLLEISLTMEVNFGILDLSKYSSFVLKRITAKTKTT